MVFLNTILQRSSVSGTPELTTASRPAAVIVSMLVSMGAECGLIDSDFLVCTHDFRLFSATASGEHRDSETFYLFPSFLFNL